MVEPGDRVELCRTDNAYTTLTPGARGTVTDVTLLIPNGTGDRPQSQVWVEWDCGATLALLVDVDEYRVLAKRADRDE